MNFICFSLIRRSSNWLINLINVTVVAYKYLGPIRQAIYDVYQSFINLWLIYDQKHFLNKLNLKSMKKSMDFDWVRSGHFL